MTDPALWIVLIMVFRWIRGAAAQVAVQPDGALVLRIEIVGVPCWPLGIQRNGWQ
jgi:hypothetical protein